MRPRHILPMMFLMALAGMLSACGGALAEADAFYAQNRYARALDVYREVYADHRRDPGVNYRIGRSFHAMQRFDRAEKYFARAVELEQGHTDAWWYLGDCRSRATLYVDALVAWDALTELQPGEAGPWSNKGLMHLYLGDLEAAEAAFRKALDLDGNHAPALLNLGLLHARHLDAPDEAERFYRRYRQVAPDGSRSAAVKDWLLARRAIADTPPAGSSPAESSRPDAASSHASRLDVASGVGPSAPAPAADATPAAPTAPPTVLPDGLPSPALLRTLMAERRYDDVVRLADRLPLSARTAEVCRLVGIAHVERRAPRAAEAWLGRALELDPDDAEATLQLGWARYYLGRTADARAIWRDGLGRFPDTAGPFRKALGSGR